MKLQTRTQSRVVLITTALLCSRSLFYFFEDPEGPNLLVVGVIAAIIYGLSTVLYRYRYFVRGDVTAVPGSTEVSVSGVVCVIVIQSIATVVLYFCMNLVPPV